ncbi:Transcriptional activator of glycolytic enzyme [Phytophthora infestans]|uniref:Transcriptional activator of glycolytic enzyme n=1 Tax=Phytophthora infestans TaxID=4787 RepID=A0A8S9UUG1_PHYIN|nr:Transcriptional activator of glycolytic enzyme [Phytophthora infestans]
MRVVFLQDSVVLRRQYPNHQLWKHSLFSTAEYASFDQELYSLIPAITQPETKSLAVVVPQIADVLKNGMESLHGKLDALAAGIDTLKALSNKRLVLSWEDSTSGHDPLQSAVTQPPFTSCAIPQSLQPRNPKLSRSISTVVDLWKKYSVGLAGNMSISEANEKLGSKWRKDPTEARFYLWRKKYYDAITKTAATHNISPNQAAEKLELARKGDNLSLNAFSRKLDTYTIQL